MYVAAEPLLFHSCYSSIGFNLRNLFVIDVVCNLMRKMIVPSLTGDFSLSDALWATGEDQFSMLPSRQRAVFDAITGDVGFAVYPLQSNAFICLFHRLEMLRGIQI